MTNLLSPLVVVLSYIQQNILPFLANLFGIEMAYGGLFESMSGSISGAFWMTIIWVPLFFLVGSAVYYGVTKLLFHVEANFTEQTYLFATFVPPLIILNLIITLPTFTPIFGWCFGLFAIFPWGYRLFINYQALKVLHGLGSGESIMVIVSSAVASVVVILLLVSGVAILGITANSGNRDDGQVSSTTQQSTITATAPPEEKEAQVDFRPLNDNNDNGETSNVETVQTATAEVRTTETAETQATGTAEAQATETAEAQATGTAETQATAIEEPRRTATPQAIATSTAINSTPIPQVFANMKGGEICNCGCPASPSAKVYDFGTEVNFCFEASFSTNASATLIDPSGNSLLLGDFDLGGGEQCKENVSLPHDPNLKGAWDLIITGSDGPNGNISYTQPFCLDECNSCNFSLG